MDDLIVIILMLIIAVVGALGQIKKRKLQQQPNNQQKGKTDSGGFWDFLEEQTDYMPHPQENEMTQEQQKMKKEEPVSMPEVVEEKPKYEFKPEQEGMSVYKIKSENELKQEKTRSTKEKWDSKRFSLRKAVIYSEILNRKYD